MNDLLEHTTGLEQHNPQPNDEVRVRYFERQANGWRQRPEINFLALVSSRVLDESVTVLPHRAVRVSGEYEDGSAVYVPLGLLCLADNQTGERTRGFFHFTPELMPVE